MTDLSGMGITVADNESDETEEKTETSTSKEILQQIWKERTLIELMTQSECI